MAKIDLKKDLRHLYFPSSREPQMVEVPALSYLMVDGEGNPGTSKDFQDAISALYSMAYTMKFRFKKAAEGSDFTVMPLEALWWADDILDFVRGKKENWKWTCMILVPDFITKTMFNDAKEQVRKKDLPALDRVRLEQLTEGLCAQMMHIGPYAAEEGSIRRIHEFIKDNGYQLAGKHHEIYISDPNRTAPEKLKTVIRQPARKT